MDSSSFRILTTKIDQLSGNGLSFYEYDVILREQLPHAFLFAE